MIDGDVETGSVMAGQSVGLVSREQSTADILDELVEQALALIDARGRDTVAYSLASQPRVAGGRDQGR